jgi:hypothetical protein
MISFISSDSAAYNFAKRLKTLRGLTPHGYVCKIWKDEPALFKNDPTQLTSGLYTVVHRTMAQPVPAAAARIRGKIAEMIGPM